MLEAVGEPASCCTLLPVPVLHSICLLQLHRGGISARGLSVAHGPRRLQTSHRILWRCAASCRVQCALPAAYRWSIPGLLWEINALLLLLCAGTELGGAYFSGSPLQAQSPSTFSTPTIGHRPVILRPLERPEGTVALSPHGDVAGA
jgi:hypothetical protein